jgi:hypothetical protein
LSQDLLHRFLTQIDIRELDHGLTATSFAKNRWAGRVVFLNHREDPPSRDFDELRFGSLEPVGIDVGDIVRNDLDLFAESSQA